MPKLKTSSDGNRLMATLYYKNNKGKTVEFDLPHFRTDRLFGIRDFIEEYTKLCVAEETAELQSRISELECKEFLIDN